MLTTACSKNSIRVWRKQQQKKNVYLGLNFLSPLNSKIVVLIQNRWSRGREVSEIWLKRNMPFNKTIHLFLIRLPSYEPILKKKLPTYVLAFQSYLFPQSTAVGTLTPAIVCRKFIPFSLESSPLAFPRSVQT